MDIEEIQAGIDSANRTFGIFITAAAILIICGIAYMAFLVFGSN